MKYVKTNTLNCFSPPVMIATFAIEIALALWVSWRYKLTPVTKLATAILVLLGVFQLAEYNVCEGSFGIDSLSWARLGYASITALPPLGLHLASRIAGKRNVAMIASAYASGIAFAGFFLMTGHGMQSDTCLGNYVIFQIAPEAAPLYTLYYYGWLMAGVAYILSQIKQTKMPNIAKSLKGLAAGYLLFMVPTTMVNIIDQSTIAGIPSIMCGFAVLLAVMIAADVLPNYFKQTVRLHKSNPYTGIIKRSEKFSK